MEKNNDDDDDDEKPLHSSKLVWMCSVSKINFMTIVLGRDFGGYVFCICCNYTLFMIF
jgi:hypothetical protein